MDLLGSAEHRQGPQRDGAGGDEIVLALGKEPPPPAGRRPDEREARIGCLEQPEMEAAGIEVAEPEAVDATEFAVLRLERQESADRVFGDVVVILGDEAALVEPDFDVVTDDSAGPDRDRVRRVGETAVELGEEEVLDESLTVASRGDTRRACGVGP
ncbi:hypothetical protein OG455_27190 [Kitasatospora sp. NBC_01287]|uniref:hypothetical protein n=1 Tax=Kitasatospora sp. NBC_01287 TaxID=2903573 RepID=UPI00224F1720|nr:hypothetical protein [Kitasatospora sp. NBC_01287]MCX4749149.1 hypothetical protein [Kitasatospora sp. NBC_01287]